MANEFIVRKGLVVEGASSGTVVNVLGSLGQLFSVTDNLTGSIFSVSDISGVPIFDVNSNGNTGIGTSSSTAKLFVNSTADGEKIRWGRNNTLVGSVGTYNGVPYIGYQGGAGGGIMFNGASIEPTGLGSARQNNLNDIGSTTYRWRNGWFGGQLISNTIGIGTSTPQTKLDVKLANNTTASIGGTISVGSFAGLSFGYSESNNSNYRHSAIVFERDDAAFGDARGKIHLLNSPSGSTSADLGDSRLTILPTGYVGIGTTSPGFKLEVDTNGVHDGIKIRGANAPGLTLQDDSSSSTSSILIQSTAAAQGNLRISADENNAANGATIEFKVSGGEKMRIDSSGNVGIGPSTTSPSHKLEVRDGTISGEIAKFSAIGATVVIESSTAGNAKLFLKPNTTGSKRAEFRVTDANDYGFLWTADTSANGTAYMELEASSTGGGDLTVKGDVIAYGSPSDKKYKENIKPIESALDKAMKLQGVTFDWKDSESILEIKKDIGFIAQDVQEVLPELVRENKKGNLSLRYQGITPILLEAIKELRAEIEELKLNNCNCNK